jgi:hypothetical protein
MGTSMGSIGEQASQAFAHPPTSRRIKNKSKLEERRKYTNNCIQALKLFLYPE